VNTETECRDIVADKGTGVQIGTFGHKLWVCVDGQCVLRIKSPEIELTDLRISKASAIPAWSKKIRKYLRGAE